MGDAIHVQSMNLGVERRLDQSGSSGKIDDHSARMDEIDLETASGEPVLNGLEIRIRYAETSAEFLRGQKLMELRRSRIVQIVDQCFQRLLLRG